MDLQQLLDTGLTEPGLQVCFHKPTLSWEACSNKTWDCSNNQGFCKCSACLKQNMKATLAVRHSCNTQQSFGQEVHMTHANHMTPHVDTSLQSGTPEAKIHSDGWYYQLSCFYRHVCCKCSHKKTHTGYKSDHTASKHGTKTALASLWITKTAVHITLW